MRNAGDGTPGGSTGRRQRVPAPAGTGRPTGNGGASLFTPAYRVRHAEAPSSPSEDGYNIGYRWSELDQPSGSYRQADYGSGAPISAWADDLPGGGYSWLTDEQGGGSRWPGSPGDDAPSVSNAIRGFPPVPDEPLPLYPPGPFAAWNRDASDRGEPASSSARPQPGEDSARMLATATITPDEFDTNHSLPAIKDPVLTDRTSAPGTRAAAGGRATQSRAGAPARGKAQPSRGNKSRGNKSRDNKSGKRTSKGSKRQPVRLAIGVAAVIIVAVAAVLVITSLGKPTTNSGANNKPSRPRVSTSPTPSRPGGKWEYIGTRRTDPVPLQVAEVFPANFTVGGVSYHAAISKEGHNCRAAVIGTALQTAVRKALCSQVLRASYLARFQKVMATIGVFNLATSAGASAAAQHAGPSEFVAALPGTGGVTSSLGQGSGLEEAVVKGHYLVLVWAENTDLAAPSTNWQRVHLTGFMNTLLQNTVNGSLSYRMVDGRPGPPAQGN